MKKGRIIKNADHCTVVEGYYSVMFPLHSILNGTIPVAITEWTVYPKDKYHFNREVRINMNVDHPNIIKTYGYYQEYYLHYLVMELADSDLLDFLKTELPMQIRKEIIKTMGKVLCYTLQQGVVHHDLKVAFQFRSDG